MKRITTILISFLIAPSLFAQQWVEMMEKGDKNFYEIREEFQDYWSERDPEHKYGYKQFMRWAYFMEQRVYPSGEFPEPDKVFRESRDFFKGLPDNSAKANGDWQPIGPVSWTSIGWNPGLGRINVIKESPQDSDVLYVGSPSGGLWKSTDGGGSWNPLTDDLAGIGVSGIAINPNHPDSIYIGTGDGDGADTYSVGVLLSPDGGESWETTGLGFDVAQGVRVSKLAFRPGNTQELWVATNEGLYRTTDGAENWQLMIGGEFMRDIEFHPTDSSIIYASSDRIHRSTDGGETFNIVPGLPSAFSVNRWTIAVTPADSSRVYALAGDQDDSSFLGLYMSTNSGESFELQSNSPNIFSYPQNGGGGGGQSWYDIALTASPTNPDLIYAGGINVWLSTDGGESWVINSHWEHPTSIGYTHADIHFLEFGEAGLYCGSDGGVFLKDGAGFNWEDLTPGLQITQFYRFGHSIQQPYTLIAGSQDNGTSLFRSDEPHLHVLGGDGNGAAVNPQFDNIMYAAYPAGNIQKSTDGGLSFNAFTEEIGESGRWVTPFRLDPEDPSIMIAAYEDVWKYDGFWQSISNFPDGPTLSSLEVAPANSDFIYTARQSTLYKTENGGEDWDDVSNGLPILSITSIRTHPMDEEQVWVTVSGYVEGSKVYYSPDAGETWENISQNLPNTPANCLAIENSTSNGVYVGTDIGVFYKNNELTNWVPFQDGLPKVIINQLEIHPTIQKLRAGTYGRGLWESNLYQAEPSAPTAQFEYEVDASCADDSITFIDQSVNATGERLWTFEGGEPETSTEYSPTVLFGEEGTYTVTLEVENEFGTATASQELDVEFAENELTFELAVDDYADETSWEVTDENGNVVADGGAYQGEAGTFYLEEFCVPEGCYTFTIYDSFGDGICCAYGDGFFVLSSDEEGELIAGGEFEDSDSTQFCFEEDVSSFPGSETNYRMSLFPNPTESNITIQLEDDLGAQEDWNIEVVSSSGRIITTKRVNNTALNEQLDSSSWPAGLYLVRVKHGNQVYRSRFVKR